MERLPISVLILVVLCGATAVVPGGATGQTGGIGIDVTVDGEPVDDGDRIVAADRPTLSTSITADREIQAVFVRVDGEDRYRNLSVGSENFSLDRELSIGPGRHSVTVIVSTNEQTESFRFQYLRDLQGPVIQFDRPSNVSLSEVKEVEANESRYRVAFRTRDFGAIRRVDLTVRYFGGRSVNGSRPNQEVENGSGFDGRPIETDSYSLNSSRRAFDREVLLGPGTTVVTVETEDEFGNVRQKSIEVTLPDDGVAPSIETVSGNFTRVNGTQQTTVEQPRFTWQAVVEDPVGVRRASGVVRVASGSGRFVRLLNSPVSNRTDNRRQVTLTEELELEPGVNYLNVTTADLFGNSNQTVYRITYDPITLAERVEPEIRLYRNRSRVAGNETQLFVEVTDGSVRSVVVEVQGLTTRETAFVDVVHNGENRSRVVSDRTLPITEERTRIDVKVVDAVGNEHVASLVVDRDRGQFVVGNRTESGFVVYGGSQTVTPTPTATPAGVTPTVETSVSSTVGSETETRTESVTANDTVGGTPPGATTAPGTGTASRVTPATATLGVGGTAGSSSGFLAPTGGVLGGTVALVALIAALAAGLFVRFRE
jgi:hypothetical protein